MSFFLAAVSKFEDLDFLIWVPGLVFLTTYVNQFPKVFAALFFMAASWLYLKKFPLSKFESNRLVTASRLVARLPEGVNLFKSTTPDFGMQPILVKRAFLTS